MKTIAVTASCISSTTGTGTVLVLGKIIRAILVGAVYSGSEAGAFMEVEFTLGVQPAIAATAFALGNTALLGAIRVYSATVANQFWVCEAQISPRQTVQMRITGHGAGAGTCYADAVLFYD